MMVGIGPEKVIKLVVSDYVRQKLRPDPEDNVFWIEAAAGFATGIVQVLCLHQYTHEVRHWFVIHTNR